MTWALYQVSRGPDSERRQISNGVSDELDVVAAASFWSTLQIQLFTAGWLFALFSVWDRHCFIILLTSDDRCQRQTCAPRKKNTQRWWLRVEQDCWVMFYFRQNEARESRYKRIHQNSNCFSMTVRHEWVPCGSIMIRGRVTSRNRLGPFYRWPTDKNQNWTRTQL